tara:strand:- start:1013 stop:1780 length:768 start_codon:yes stop_codon:yes gene_type:complete
MVEKVFIRFFGMKRGGNHALQNWILPKFKGGVYFNNNADFKPVAKKKHSDGLDCLKRYDHISKASRDKNDVVFIGYEDLLLSYCLAHPSNHNNVYGAYDKYRDIFVVRDPYNLFASRAKHYDHGVGSPRDLCVQKRHDFPRLVMLWKDMAKRLLDTRDREIGIYYDEWFVNKGYRKSLCDWMGVEFSDKGKELVSAWGGGSSFDRTNKPAHKMGVLDRKNQYKDYEFYYKLTEDKELNELLDTINESFKQQFPRL